MDFPVGGVLIRRILSMVETRITGSGEPGNFAFRHAPDPRSDLRSCLDHVGKRLLIGDIGAWRDDEHRDGCRLLFRHCHLHDWRIPREVKTQPLDDLSLQVAEFLQQPELVKILEREPMTVDHHQRDLFHRGDARD